MKIKKRILSFALAVMLIAAMAIPASAYTVSMGRQWGNFSYGTSDTCNTRSYYCTIEGMSNDYTLRTDVQAYWTESYAGNSYAYYTGSTGTNIVTHNRVVDRAMTHINCYHYIGGTHASSQRVEVG